MRQEVRFESNFTKDDYVKVSRFNIYGRSPITMILCCIVFLAGLISLVFQPAFGIPWFFAILFIVYPIGLILYCESRIKKNLKKRNIKSKETLRITLSEQGLLCIKEGQQDIFNWDDIAKIYETKDYFVVYTKTQKIVSMVKRDINTDDAYTVRNLVINNMSYKHYKLKS